MLFQILRTLIASVPVIDRKYLYLGPLIIRHFRLLLLRLNNIQNNRNSIFICFSDQTNMCIRSKRFDDSELLVGRFWILKHWQRAAGAYLHVIFGWLIKINSGNVLRARSVFGLGFRVRLIHLLWLMSGWLAKVISASTLAHRVHVAALTLIDRLVWWLLSHDFVVLVLVSALSWFNSFLVVGIQRFLLIDSHIIDCLAILIRCVVQRVCSFIYNGVSASHLVSTVSTWLPVAWRLRTLKAVHFQLWGAVLGSTEIGVGRLPIEGIGIICVLSTHVGCFTHLNAIIWLYLTFTADHILLFQILRLSNFILTSFLLFHQSCRIWRNITVVLTSSWDSRTAWSWLYLRHLMDRPRWIYLQGIGAMIQINWWTIIWLYVLLIYRILWYDLPILKDRVVTVLPI